ncbi:acyltransferase family protein [Sphingomonas canadensis]|uniref:Acyltransferase family protein n=1 Tax=Sphingomonas canadensis TaxID=1219257 RepID=A0ABW3H3J3_9SPHN|nr:acyltransferase [Sphingomonas canadensis]MCW3835512.1 acyltransferase [Sphingomonas canadensis]
MRSERFEALDMLRGIAALAIVTRHFPWLGDAPVALPRSYLAVDLFFVLSGFVIAHGYGRALAGGMGVRAFMLQRLARLGPLYLLATLAGAAVWLAAMAAGDPAAPAPGHWIAALIPNLLMLPAPPMSAALADVPYPFVGPAWSLFWELAVNLAFAVLALRLSRRVIARVLAAGLALLAVAAASHGSLDTGPYWSSFSGGAARVVWSFFAGVALYRWRPRLRPGFRVPGWLTTCAMLLLFSVPMTMPGGAAYDFACAAIGFPLLVLLAADAHDPAVPRAAGRWLGYCSYGVYVLHGPVLLMLERALSAAGGPPLASLGYAGALLFAALALAAAWAATRWIDTPARAWLKARLARPAPLTTRRPAVP